MSVKVSHKGTNSFAPSRKFCHRTDFHELWK